MRDSGLQERCASRVRACDPRVTIVLALLAGILTWRSGAVGLGLYALALAALLVLLSVSGSIGARSVDAGVVRSFVVFIAFWSALKLGLDLLRGEPAGSAAADTATLALRLFVLVCLGLVLTLVASPRALGLALAWFARPFLGKQAWKAALALSLMVHFLPMALRAAAAVTETIRRRCPELPWRSRALLLPQTTIRVLSQKTWDQTLAIAARRLDSPAAWRASFKWRASEVGVAVVIVGVLLALAGA